MKTSTLGIKAIAKREGTILHVYKDSKGLPTAGVGHLITEYERSEFPVGKPISQTQSDAWLAADLKECEDAVNSLGVSLKQNEFDALVSLAFNIGVAGFKKSTVARKLKAGDKKAAAQAILLWNKPPEIQGRRRTEYSQFLTPYQTSATAPAESSTSGNSAANTPKVITATEADPTHSEQPSITTAVEQTQAETKQEGDTATTTQTTVTAQVPKGDPPETPPVQVSTRGPLAMWLFSGGGIMTIGTAVWGIVQANLGAVAVGIICFTFLVCIIIFRHAITDAIRMQTAADVDKRNVT